MNGMTADTIIRVPAGTSHGGRFAAHNRLEGNLALLAIRSGDPIGYTYRAENLSGPELIETMIHRGVLSPAARDMNVEDVLNQHADANAVDRDDEYSFDSDGFPKNIFAEQLECSDGWAGELAPDHLVVEGEFPYCVKCGHEFEELSTLEH